MVRKKRKNCHSLIMETNQNISSISLKEYAEESYLNYAMYVILDRHYLMLETA